MLRLIWALNVTNLSYVLQIIVSSEGKNATTLIRIHIDPTPTPKPKTTTSRVTTTPKPTAATRKGAKAQPERSEVIRDIEVFKSSVNNKEASSEKKNGNLESGNRQSFAFSVKENKARK